MFAKVMHRLAGKMPRERRMHGFCLGAAKTGTTSLAAMFEPYYRSAHEPDTVALTETIAKILDEHFATGSAAAGVAGQGVAVLDVTTWLLARDRRLNLEMEASHPLGYMAPWLPWVFPQARFVITLRDPLPWLKSRLNFHYYKAPPEWQSYRDLIWSRWHKGYGPEESRLRDMGLYSIDAYLAQYAEQYQLLFRHVPANRRLVIKTEDLNTSAEKIGAFLAIDPATIIPQHANAFPRETSVIDQLPREFVAQRIEAHCQWMEAYL